MGRSSTVHAMVHHSTNPSTVPQKVPDEYIYCNPRCYLPNISGFDCIPGAVAMLGPPRPRPLPPDFWGGDFGRNSSIFSSNGSSSYSSFSNREAYTLGLKFELVNSGPTVTHPSKGRNSSFYNEDKECMMGHDGTCPHHVQCSILQPHGRLFLLICVQKYYASLDK